MDDKACIKTLENMKTGACRQEKVAIEQAIECMKKMQKLKFWIEAELKK